MFAVGEAARARAVGRWADPDPHPNPYALLPTPSDPQSGAGCHRNQRILERHDRSRNRSVEARCTRRASRIQGF